MWWAIGAAIFAVVLWIGRKVIVGAITPVTVSGKILLRNTLVQEGVDVSQIPDQCLQDITDHVVKMTKLTRELSNPMNRGWHEDVVNGIVTEARIVARLINGGIDKLGLHDTLLERTKTILGRHGVRLSS